MTRTALLGLLLMLALPAAGQIYSYIDDQGNRVFTDRPAGRAAEQVQSRPINSMPAMPVATPTPSRRQADTEPAAYYRQLNILQPEADATIRDNAGSLVVSLSSEPALQPGHQYRLLLDGNPITTSDAATLTLEYVNRGTHQLTAEIIDNQGKTLLHSAPQTFHMMRTSLAQRRMVRPCQKADYGVRPECPLKDKPVEKKNIPFVPFL
ncbi:DUF4124 domain-containing protein [Pseudomonas saudiphocaensis]|uniref:DUF4124 domain-containing protein n=1 Tax=Pseudomonas saudiphocaensis TaxID=1499686 RepID=UPI000F7B996F|nr:DUF4124 domain-containing protein [Pseudomonas saudiphocaensis]RRV13668.1 DUF4124 domain-containing protein [Pseudomonas saudiphocaensis]